MAVIIPTIETDLHKKSLRVRVAWLAIVNGDTCQSFDPIFPAALAASQINGTFGGAALALQGSEDGTNYVTISDVNAVAISQTVAARQDFSTATKSIKPLLSGGVASSLNIYLTLWAV